MLGCNLKLSGAAQAFSLAVLWPMMMGLIGITTYLAIIYSSQISKACHTSYAPSVLVTATNIVGSMLAKSTVELEEWAPRTQIMVTIPQTWKVPK